ncbi:cyclin-dependent kinase inhibitor 1-like [Scleropages formosus]|uniref:Cyclin-dependent kinase inhibitor 1-like n=1 Tax=Scleropages formosus TaxID=113540 RepID=A0A0P7UVZ1_SCLFO|nr:cyclin-dependent kinase inhibitor 1-like [Scleropages formosus]
MPIEKRVLAALRSGSTRRILFGPVDHEGLRRDHQKLLRDDLEDASRRWGFDFLTDTPIEGSDFQWESVPVAKVPVLYRPSTVSVGEPQRLGAAPKPAVESVQRSRETVSCISESCNILSQNVESVPEVKQGHAVKRKQTNITGVWGKRQWVGPHVVFRGNYAKLVCDMFAVLHYIT